MSSTKTFTIVMREESIAFYEVEASSKEEAMELYVKGEVEEVDRSTKANDLVDLYAEDDEKVPEGRVEGKE